MVVVSTISEKTKKAANAPHTRVYLVGPSIRDASRRTRPSDTFHLSISTANRRFLLPSLKLSLEEPAVFLMATIGTNAGLRRASIFHNRVSYQHALARRLRVPRALPAPATAGKQPSYSWSEAESHVRWLAEAADIPKGALGDSTPLSTQQRQTLLRMALQLRQGMPIAYVLRTVPFADLELAIEPPTLIPRPETEAWTVRLADRFASRVAPQQAQSLRIVDLCTGTGAIGL